MTDGWTLHEIVSILDEWYPPDTAEDWDRVGLVLGDDDVTISRVLLAVDPVAATVEEAIDHSADLLITHHPLFLRGTSFIPSHDPKGALVTELIRKRVGLFCAHTNADIAVGGVADALAAAVGLRDTHPLVPSGVDSRGREIGLGRVGTVDEVPLGVFADRVAAALPAGPHGLLVGGDESRLVSRVAVSGGSGDGFLSDARQAGADVYLCADLRHHPASEHLEAGAPALLCASHWASEWPWLPVLAESLRSAAREANVELSVEVSTIVTEPWTNHRATTGGTK